MNLNHRYHSVPWKQIDSKVLTKQIKRYKERNIIFQPKEVVCPYCKSELKDYIPYHVPGAELEQHCKKCDMYFLYRDLVKE